MKSNRWSRIEEIFEQALQRPIAERTQFLSEACSNDPELLSEVQSLLENDDNAESALSSLIVNDLRQMTESSLVSGLGLRVGPYLLVRELDSGGMGVVYLAVRSDDQYFQIVAIKMIRRGLDSADMLLRFRLERQILATLNHPNIGEILDGGRPKMAAPSSRWNTSKASRSRSPVRLAPCRTANANTIVTSIADDITIVALTME